MVYLVLGWSFGFLTGAGWVLGSWLRYAKAKKGEERG